MSKLEQSPVSAPRPSATVDPRILRDYLSYPLSGSLDERFLPTVTYRGETTTLYIGDEEHSRPHQLLVAKITGDKVFALLTKAKPVQWNPPKAVVGEYVIETDGEAYQVTNHSTRELRGLGVLEVQTNAFELLKMVSVAPSDGRRLTSAEQSILANPTDPHQFDEMHLAQQALNAIRAHKLGAAQSA